MKYCPSCERDRDESEFYIEPNRKGGGLSSACKDCSRERKRRYWRETYYPAHAEQQKANVTERRRRRAKEKSA